ncbi:histidine phosphatase family protein [Zhihengliuella sp.]|uniref:SixA phosphatase family protein n=1 Tax=Zhihengliuella sp. TaxID=1954483 RepID=UPI0028125B66|nr:histidine phosphatase family protein [Zhihengliuella sp.]
MNRHHLKRLLLLRHAQADFLFGVEDRDRPLGSRGEQEAPSPGHWMLEHDVVPDYIVCSDALRARSTCVWVSHVLGERGPTPYVDSRVYGADVARLLSIVNETPGSVGTLLVIGHMPTLQDLALRLASADSDHEAVMELAMEYPTAGLTVLETTAAWAELDGRDARVTDFVPPSREERGDPR